MTLRPGSAGHLFLSDALSLSKADRWFRRLLGIIHRILRCL